MKKIFGLLLVSASLLLTGCLDTFDEITINADGSGTYRQTVNMDKMFEVMEMAAMMDTSAATAETMKQMESAALDTTYSLANKEGEFTDDERRLLANASSHIVMNKKEGKFQIATSYPFTKIADLGKIIELQGSGKASKGIDKAIPGLGSAMGGDGDEEGMPNANKTFDIIAGDGFVERKVDKVSLDELLKGSQGEEVQQMKSMLEGITYRTKINLPRPAKKVVGDKVKLSDDKRTVTIEGTMVDLMDAPKKLEFRVEY